MPVSAPSLTEIPSQAEIDRERAERHLAPFIRQAWPILEPETEYLHNWHIDLVCEYLEAVTAGEITRLIIDIPPRYMKSLSVSVCWPVWEWIRRPSLRFMFAGYSAELSTDHSMSRRRILESDWFRANWPHVELAGDQNVKTKYENTARGVMLATSFGGKATGMGGNRLVIDDPVNPRKAYSDAERKGANEEYDRTFSTRLDDKKRDAIVVVMQRIHDDDLVGHILGKATGGDWTVLKIPAEARDAHVVTFPRSGRQVHRPAGDVLWPEREGPAELAAVREDLGPTDYEAQYQQEPAPPAGTVVQLAWLRYYREPPAAFDELVQSWDCSFKDEKTSDYVVGQIWGRRGAACYLLAQYRARADLPATLTMIRHASAAWPRASLKLVEEKANGAAVIATLRSEVPGLVPINPTDSKLARLHAVTPSFEAGNVYLPDPAYLEAGDRSWVPDYVLELTRFPKATHDDQVDATTQALSRLRANARRPAEIVME